MGKPCREETFLKCNTTWREGVGVGRQDGLDLSALGYEATKALMNTVLNVGVPYTVVPPYPLIQYPQFSAAPKKIGKLKK
jgi:hypothetical protein